MRRLMPRGTKPVHRLYAGITALVALALLATGVLAYVQSLTAGHGEFQDLQSAQSRILSEEAKTPSVIVVGQNLDIPHLRIDGQLRVTMPYALASQLRDAQGRRIAGCGPGGRCSVRPSARNVLVFLRFVARAATGPLSNVALQEKLPLARLFTAPTFPTDPFSVLTLPVSIPLAGDAAVYPQDSYSFDCHISFVSFQLTDAHGNAVPVQFGFTPGLIAGDMDTSSSGQSPFPGDYHLTVTFSRKTVDVGYIYMISLVPLAFAFLFLHLLFVNERYKQLDLQAFIPALVAAILAILPLRAILVPPDIGKLTRVDILLGIGLVAIVCGALFKYIVEVWQLPESAQEGE